jgi:EpsG family
MAYYLVPYLIWAARCIDKAYRRELPFRLKDYVFALPLILLAILRGEVGSDTTTYLSYAQDAISYGGNATADVEPGFLVLMDGIARFTDDPRIVVAVITVLAATLFFLMLHMWEDGECLFSLILIPFFYFTFTMNGLRMGIALPLVVIGIVEWEGKNYFWGLATICAAISVQMTVAIAIPLLIVVRCGAGIRHRWAVYGMMSAIGVIGIYYIFRDRTAYKILEYASLYSPTEMSGIAPLTISCVSSTAAIWLCTAECQVLGRLFVGIQVLCFGVTQLSYAGLRLQAMALFVQLLALAHCRKRPISSQSIGIVVLLSGISFAAVMLNFLSSAGDLSAFIPYRFLWEEQ